LVKEKQIWDTSESSDAVSVVVSKKYFADCVCKVAGFWLSNSSFEIQVFFLPRPESIGIYSPHKQLDSEASRSKTEGAGTFYIRLYLMV
jgi:hypothetical protein